MSRWSSQEMRDLLDAYIEIVDAVDAARAVSDSGVNPFAMLDEAEEVSWCQTGCEEAVPPEEVGRGSRWWIWVLAGAGIALGCALLWAMFYRVMIAIGEGLGTVVWLMARAL